MNYLCSKLPCKQPCIITLMVKEARNMSRKVQISLMCVPWGVAWRTRKIRKLELRNLILTGNSKLHENMHQWKFLAVRYPISQKTWSCNDNPILNVEGLLLACRWFCRSSLFSAMTCNNLKCLLNCYFFQEILLACQMLYNYTPCFSTYKSRITHTMWHTISHFLAMQSTSSLLNWPKRVFLEFLLAQLNAFFNYSTSLHGFPLSRRVELSSQTHLF